MSRRRLLPAATLAVAVLTAVMLAVLPSYQTQSCTTDNTGASACATSWQSLVQHEGTSVVLVLLIPAAIAAIGVLWPKPPVLRGVGIALTVGVVISALSIGALFLPTVIVSWIAAVRAR